MSIPKNLQNLSGKLLSDISFKTHMDGDTLMKHMDSFVIYLYTKEDFEMVFDILQNKIIPALNNYIATNSGMAGELLSASERENKYMRSSHGHDSEKGEGGSDTDNFAAMYAAYVCQNPQFIKGIQNAASEEDIYRILTSRLRDFWDRWTAMPYSERQSLSSSARNYFGATTMIGSWRK
jgi:hypothetical protein